MSLRFRKGSAGIDAIRAATEEAWREALADPSMVAQLEREGVHLGEGGLPDRSPFDVRPDSSGLDPTLTAIVIGLGAWAGGVVGDIAKEIVLDVWREVLLPRIKDRLGDDAVGPEEDD